MNRQKKYNAIKEDTSMKTRTLVRKHGWTSVEVDAKKIEWDLNYWYNNQDNKENRVHYREIVEWCERVAGAGNYASTIQVGGFSHSKKRFIFKQAKHATMFRLKWLTS